MAIRQKNICVTIRLVRIRYRHLEKPKEPRTLERPESISLFVIGEYGILESHKKSFLGKSLETTVGCKLEASRISKLCISSAPGLSRSGKAELLWPMGRKGVAGPHNVYIACSSHVHLSNYDCRMSYAG